MLVIYLLLLLNNTEIRKSFLGVWLYDNDEAFSGQKGVASQLGFTYSLGHSQRGETKNRWCVGL